MDIFNFEVDNNSIEPLYEQIYHHIDKLISDNILKPGDKLPSESELESQFDVSRITIRRAVQELVYENKVKRIAGKGSFVLSKKVEPLPALTSFSENMIAQGYHPSYSNSKINLVFPPPDVTKFLNVSKNDKVLNIKRLMLADELPMSFQDSYLPGFIFYKNPNIFVPELMNKISLYKILELEFGINLFKAEERVDASKATKEEAQLLKIDTNDSLLVVERIAFDDEDKPVEYVKMIYPSKRYRYKVKLYRSDKNNLSG
ncbi:MAG TPA: hypothetical protein DDX29_04010 [Clostridiales bacterium]|nr:hypothetical protein [Clostridiales bacterium]